MIINIILLGFVYIICIPLFANYNHNSNKRILIINSLNSKYIDIVVYLKLKLLHNADVLVCDPLPYF